MRYEKKMFFNLFKYQSPETKLEYYMKFELIMSNKKKNHLLILEKALNEFFEIFSCAFYIFN